MVYDCGSCLAKYILCFFNFVVFLAGSAVLAVGIWLAVDKNSFIGLSKIVPSEHVQQFTQPAVIEQGSYILIAVGAFMFIVSFLGYCGALRESQCLLTTVSHVSNVSFLPHFPLNYILRSGASRSFNDINSGSRSTASAFEKTLLKNYRRKQRKLELFHKRKITSIIR
jgi:hypothetical protein